MREVGRGELKKIVDAVIVMFAKDHNLKPVPRLWSEEDEVRLHSYCLTNLFTHVFRSPQIWLVKCPL